ncbi:MAG: hypothetical protein HFE63_06640 [Clostridiales bacterium]|nr:hypothetical protein [Clostridiales bacterium]
MKNLIILIFLVLLFNLVSCNNNEAEAIDMMDALKISTWVLDKDLEGTGYWAYSEDWRTYPNWGYWVSNDDNARQLKDDKVFKCEQLKLNEVRTMAPIGYKGSNLNVYLDYDGIIEVDVDSDCDEKVRLCYIPLHSDNSSSYTVVYGNKFRAHAPIRLNICPIGRFSTFDDGIVLNSTLTDVEYNINIKAYEEDGTLAITAKLKLVVLKDEAYPYEDVLNNTRLFGPNEECSRFLSIELVSYEYSDIYKIGNDAYKPEGKE